MQDAKEEVRARLNIEDVIGEYVQLKRAGRNFKGLSPFTGEKTPSFTVSPDKQIWHDFSSGKGGDVFSFVMLVEGMDFRQALEHLARRAGVDLSMYESSRSGELAQKKQRLLEANRLAVQYYQQSMLKNPAALEYIFRHRGLSKEIVTAFQIGYAPSSGDALVQFLTKKGFTLAELHDAGLLNRFGSDLFRGRMMVPLMDASGQVIGFTARIIEDDPKAPKYLNTPQTLLYDKSRHVFGLSQAKEAIRQADYSVIVEGNLDVVSSHQVAVKHVVATAGTAMTEYHLKALSRLSQQVRLAFDGDKAGIAATERAIALAQQVAIELSVISMPASAKDPDELIKQDPKLWQSAIEQAVPAVDWLLSQYEQREDLTTAAGKRTYTSSALRLIKALSDKVEQDHYLQLMARTSGASLEALRGKLADVSGDQTDQKRRKVVAPINEAQNEEVTPPYQDDVLAALIYEPTARPQLAALDLQLFVGEARRALASFLAESSEAIEETPETLKKYDTYVKIVLLRGETRYATWTPNERSLEAARLLRQMTTEHMKQKRQLLTSELRAAEDEQNDVRAQEIRAELNTLIKEMRHG